MPISGSLRTLTQVVRACSNDTRGAVAVTFAITSIVVLATAALAVDGAYWYKRKVLLQEVADAAALAAAEGLSQEGSTSLETGTEIARKFVHAKLGTHTPIVAIDQDNGQVSVGLSEKGKQYLSAAVGVSEPTISVISVAGMAKQPAKACIIALDPDSDRGIDFSLGGNVSAPNCAIWSNSRSSASIDANGSGTVVAETTCAVGGIAKGTLAIQPAAKANCAPVEDPLERWSPPTAASCPLTLTAVFRDGAVLSPGTYCGGVRLSGSGVITLSPGVYIMKDGGFRATSGVSVVAEGVTIVTVGTEASIDFGGSASIRLTAPTSGPTAGIAIASGRNEPVFQSKIGGGAEVIIGGTIYLPTHTVSFGGNSQTSAPAENTVFIGKSIKFLGGARVDVRADTASIPGHFANTEKQFVRLIR